MSKQDKLGKLAKAVYGHSKAGAVAAANEAVAASISPMEAINNELMVGIKQVGDKFGKYEYRCHTRSSPPKQCNWQSASS